MIVIGRLEGNGFYSSRELMEELIVAVQSLGQKGCFDYIQLGTTIISVLISVIESSPDSCVKCYTMFLPFLLIKIDVFS